MQTCRNLCGRIKRVDWSHLCTWEFLRNPIAICTAMSVPVIIAIAVNSADAWQTLDEVWIATTVIRMMVFGTAEEVFVQTFYKTGGLAVGIAIGGFFGYLHSIMISNGISTVGSTAFQLGVESAIVFTCAVLFAIFPSLHEFLLVVSLGAATLVFTSDWTTVWSRAASIGLAAFFCVFFTALFYFTAAADFLFKEHRKAMKLMMRMCRQSVCLTSLDKHELDSINHHIRSSLSASDSVSIAYKRWRRFTFRKIEYNFNLLSESFRPLYYETFSIYWSHVETARRSPDATRMYCDLGNEYCVIFERIRKNMTDDLDGLISVFNSLLVRTRGDENLETIFNTLTTTLSHLSSEFTSLCTNYITHRDTCFSSHKQRWNTADYLVNLSTVLMELCSYSKAIVIVAAKGDTELVRRTVNTINRIDDHILQQRFEPWGEHG